MYTVDKEIINYIRESHVVNLRMSPTRCYLLQQVGEGNVVQGPDDSLLDLSIDTTGPKPFGTIWQDSDGVDLHPDLRITPDHPNGLISIVVDGNDLKRIRTPDDIIQDDEFAAVKRNDLPSRRVEIVFNSGFDPTGKTIQYRYTTLKPGINPVRVKLGEDESHSLHGWKQYLNDYADDHQDRNQILVRMPLPVRDRLVMERGEVVTESNECWTLWYPVVDDGDIVVVPANQTVTGEEERFEINEVKRSIIQNALVSQRFHITLLERSDNRYTIPYIT